MKIFATVAIVQVLLLVTEARRIAAVDSKLVACFYSGPYSIFYGALDIENIDASICSHLVVDLTTLTNRVDGREKKLMRSSTEGMPKSFEGLKAANPDLKVILKIPYWYLRWIQYMSGSPGTSNMTQNTMSFLRETGLDGLDFSLDMTDIWESSSSENLDEVVDVICELKTEFDKYGYIITTTSRLGHLDKRQGNETYNYTKLARCCDHIKVFGVSLSTNATVRLSSLSMIKSSVDLFIERGFQPNKILISVPAFGTLHPIENHRDIGELDDTISYHLIYLSEGWRSNHFLQNNVGSFIFHKHLVREMNNSSLAWTIRRDEETKEPYAFTETGLWASYEDRTSMEAKASYVLEKGLGGIAIFPINSEDSEGIEGEGRFPLTRAVYNAFRRGLQTDGNTS
ncbi:hypothetical protein J437_LFUL014760 [Ladona fulva]|uniref:GH18 domain-containing protein n=1 Tax=Ladona fulva TaxID=123851 RepID=A0A8K0KG14_LADFU|nr:hypothetical protein J437_LFUL014760 [Ladona fulva]